MTISAFVNDLPDDAPHRGARRHYRQQKRNDASARDLAYATALVTEKITIHDDELRRGRKLRDGELTAR